MGVAFFRLTLADDADGVFKYDGLRGVLDPDKAGERDGPLLLLSREVDEGFRLFVVGLTTVFLIAFDTMTPEVEDDPGFSSPKNENMLVAVGQDGQETLAAHRQRDKGSC